MQIAEGEVVAGRYRLESPLAHGGMGSVWIARHLQLDSRVAVKFMDTTVAVSPAARARFEREAKAAALIRSPHVVAIHDYGVESGTPFLVMELLEGEDLGSRIKEVGPLPLPIVAGIVTHVARALRLAHEAGIVHRDLKPGNVFLTINDDTEIAKVLDFGIAKTRGLLHQPSDPDEATRSDQILGSPQYMSPEQARASRDVDHRSDLWSLAVIAYRALTAKLPFSAASVAGVLVKICADPAAPPSTHRPDLPPAVDRFFERALAKDPDRRYQTASDLAFAFAEAVGVSSTGELTTMDRRRERRMTGNSIRPSLANAEAVTALEAHLVALGTLGTGAPVDPTADPDSPTVPTGVSTMSSHSGTTFSGSGELLGGVTPHQLSVSNEDLTLRKPPPQGLPIPSMAAAPKARGGLRGPLISAGIGLGVAIAAILAARAIGLMPTAGGASPLAPGMLNGSAPPSQLSVTVEERPRSNEITTSTPSASTQPLPSAAPAASLHAATAPAHVLLAPPASPAPVTPAGVVAPRARTPGPAKKAPDPLKDM